MKGVRAAGGVRRSQTGEGWADCEIRQDLELSGRAGDRRRRRKSPESWDRSGVWPTFPLPRPLPATPGSGPPLSPPESSLLRAAPGTERAPPPAPTATENPQAWPAGAATPGRATPRSDLRDRLLAVSGRATPTHAPPPSRPHRPRPQPVALAVLFKASPLFCRRASRLNYPVRSCQALALSLVPVLADFPGLRFLVTVPRSRALETGTQAQPPSRGRHPGNCTLPQAPPPPRPRPCLFQVWRRQFTKSPTHS